jgi:hypothetical protein
MILNNIKLAIAICLMGATASSYGSVQQQKTPDQSSISTNTSILLGFATFGANDPVACLYDENHTYDIAGTITGYRSNSNPFIIYNAAGAPIGVLTPSPID